MKKWITVVFLASAGILFGQTQRVPVDAPAEMKKLPTTPLEGLLLDSSRHPLAGQAIVLQFEPGCDNPDCIVARWHVASATTGYNGAFHFDVPIILDGFGQFGRPLYGRQFVLTSGNAILSSPDLAPRWIPYGGLPFSPHVAYLKSMTIIRTEQGTIAGKLGMSFLKQNKLPANLKDYLQGKGRSIAIALSDTGGKSTAFPRPEPDGRFLIQCPPGIYDLSVHIGRNGKSIDVTVQKGIDVTEGNTTVIEIP